jgi:hypothetical protein
MATSGEELMFAIKWVAVKKNVFPRPLKEESALLAQAGYVNPI